jgi:hypothetical protein
MVKKALFAASLAVNLTMSGSAGHAWSGEFHSDRPPSPDRHYKRYVGRFFGPRSHYAAAVQTGVYDSCWRRRVITTEWGTEVLSKWICHNYTTYGSHFDWGYGTAPADRFYGEPWW